MSDFSFNPLKLDITFFHFTFYNKSSKHNTLFLFLCYSSLVVFGRKHLLRGPLGVSASQKDVEVFQGDSQPLSCTTQNAGRDTSSLKKLHKIPFCIEENHRDP